MALVDDNITWFTIYACCVPPFILLLLASLPLCLRSVFQKSWRSPKSQILTFTTLSCIAALINNLLRMISLTAFDVRPWVLVLFIYIAQFMSGIFNFDAHMRLVMLWAQMYHVTFSTTDRRVMARRVSMIQWIVAGIVHCFALSILILAIIIVIIFRLVYAGNANIENMVLPNPAVVYGALFVVYMLLSLSMTVLFLLYGFMLAYKIKTSPLSKSSDIKRFTILTSIAVGVHFLYVVFMILGVVGLGSTLQDDVKNATKHIWPFFYLLGSVVIIISTTILLCFFGRESAQDKKMRMKKKRMTVVVSQEQKRASKLRDIELKEQEKSTERDKIESLVDDEENGEGNQV